MLFGVVLLGYLVDAPDTTDGWDGMSGESADGLSHLPPLFSEAGQDAEPSGLPVVTFSEAFMQPWVLPWR